MVLTEMKNGDNMLTSIDTHKRIHERISRWRISLQTLLNLKFNDDSAIIKQYQTI